MSPEPHAKRILVVAHDAGAAEVIAAWVAHHPEHQYTFLIEGPARQVFMRRCQITASSDVTQLESLVRASDLILCGTGWASQRAQDIIRVGRELSCRTAVYLDHWNEYRRRFEIAGRVELPDEVWVGDPYAFAIAEQELPGASIRLEPNLYLADMADAIADLASTAPARSGEGWRVLYLGEAVREAADSYNGHNVFGCSEIEALEAFLQYLMDTQTHVAQVLLRLHPAEARDKYDAVIERWSNTFAISKGQPTQTLAEDIAWSEWVVGLDTMAMAIAVTAGRRVSTTIPPHGRPPTIPLPGIERLFA